MKETKSAKEPEDSSGSSDGAESTSSGTNKKKSRATTQSLAHDLQLRDLLASLKDSSIKDVLTLQDCEVTKGEKKQMLLLIPDYIFSDTVLQQTEEDILSENACVKTVLKRGPKKPSPRELTVSQWVGANART